MKNNKEKNMAKNSKKDTNYYYNKTYLTQSEDDLFSNTENDSHFVFKETNSPKSRFSKNIRDNSLINHKGKNKNQAYLEEDRSLSISSEDEIEFSHSKSIINLENYQHLIQSKQNFVQNIKNLKNINNNVSGGVNTITNNASNNNFSKGNMFNKSNKILSSNVNAQNSNLTNINNYIQSNNNNNTNENTESNNLNSNSKSNNFNNKTIDSKNINKTVDSNLQNIKHIRNYLNLKEQNKGVKRSHEKHEEDYLTIKKLEEELNKNKSNKNYDDIDIPFSPSNNKKEIYSSSNSNIGNKLSYNYKEINEADLLIHNHYYNNNISIMNDYGINVNKNPALNKYGTSEVNNIQVYKDYQDKYHEENYNANELQEISAINNYNINDEEENEEKTNIKINENNDNDNDIHISKPINKLLFNSMTESNDDLFSTTLLKSPIEYDRIQSKITKNNKKLKQDYNNNDYNIMNNSNKMVCMQTENFTFLIQGDPLYNNPNNNNNNNVSNLNNTINNITNQEKEEYANYINHLKQNEEYYKNLNTNLLNDIDKLESVLESIFKDLCNNNIVESSLLTNKEVEDEEKFDIIKTSINEICVNYNNLLVSKQQLLNISENFNTKTIIEKNSDFMILKDSEIINNKIESVFKEGYLEASKDVIKKYEIKIKTMNDRFNKEIMELKSKYDNEIKTIESRNKNNSIQRDTGNIRNQILNITSSVSFDIINNIKEVVQVSNVIEKKKAFIMSELNISDTSEITYNKSIKTTNNNNNSNNNATSCLCRVNKEKLDFYSCAPYKPPSISKNNSVIIKKKKFVISNISNFSYLIQQDLIYYTNKKSLLENSNGASSCATNILSNLKKSDKTKTITLSIESFESEIKPSYKKKAMVKSTNSTNLIASSTPRKHISNNVINHGNTYVNEDTNQTSTLIFRKQNHKIEECLRNLDIITNSFSLLGISVKKDNVNCNITDDNSITTQTTMTNINISDLERMLDNNSSQIIQYQKNNSSLQNNIKNQNDIIIKLEDKLSTLNEELLGLNRIIKEKEEKENNEDNEIIPELLSEEQTFKVFITFVNNAISEKELYFKFIDNKTLNTLREFILIMEKGTKLRNNIVCDVNNINKSRDLFYYDLPVSRSNKKDIYKVTRSTTPEIITTPLFNNTINKEFLLDNIANNTIITNNNTNLIDDSCINNNEFMSIVNINVNSNNKTSNHNENPSFTNNGKLDSERPLGKNNNSNNGYISNEAYNTNNNNTNVFTIRQNNTNTNIGGNSNSNRLNYNNNRLRNNNLTKSYSDIQELSTIKNNNCITEPKYVDSIPHEIEYTQDFNNYNQQMIDNNNNYETSKRILHQHLRQNSRHMRNSNNMNALNNTSNNNYSTYHKNISNNKNQMNKEIMNTYNNDIINKNNNVSNTIEDRGGKYSNIVIANSDSSNKSKNKCNNISFIANKNKASSKNKQNNVIINPYNNVNNYDTNTNYYSITAENEELQRQIIESNRRKQKSAVYGNSSNAFNNNLDEVFFKEEVLNKTGFNSKSNTGNINEYNNYYNNYSSLAERNYNSNTNANVNTNTNNNAISNETKRLQGSINSVVSNISKKTKISLTNNNNNNNNISQFSNITYLSNNSNNNNSNNNNSNFNLFNKPSNNNNNKNSNFIDINSHVNNNYSNNTNNRLLYEKSKTQSVIIKNSLNKQSTKNNASVNVNNSNFNQKLFKYSNVENRNSGVNNNNNNIDDSRLSSVDGINNISNNNSNSNSNRLIKQKNVNSNIPNTINTKNQFINFNNNNINSNSNKTRDNSIIKNKNASDCKIKPSKIYEKYKGMINKINK